MAGPGSRRQAPHPARQQQDQAAIARLDFAAFDRDYRSYLHRKQLTSDLTGHAIGAVVIAVCGMRLLLDGLWQSAFLAFCSTVLSLLTSAFITYHPMLWCRHRELLFCLGFVFHYSVAAFIGASGLNFMAHHGGSCFRMIVHFTYSNTAIWQLLNALLCRMVFRRLIFVQLLLAPVALPWGGRLCRDALSHPASAAVICRLFRNISQLSFFYAAPFSALPPSSDPSTQEMCCAINTWTLVLCGLVVPLYLAFYTEEPSRQAFLVEWRRHNPMSGTNPNPSSRNSSGSEDASAHAARAASLPAARRSRRLSRRWTEAELAEAPAPPPLLVGRKRHGHLQERLHALKQDPSEAAELEQEAVIEMLRPQPPPQLKRVVAEAAFIAVLSFPLIVLLVDATSDYLCAG